jgi:lipid II isoglutaminyl synthase (glutamine-hydrolysing)
MKQKIIIGWLYPTLMNIYGDRGNIIALRRRCFLRDIATELINLDLEFSEKTLEECDILLMGGAQDKQQEAVAKDLFAKKNYLKKAIEKGIPGLFICGAYQFLGNYYKEANGNIINGLGIFDLYTENPGQNAKRLIGNMVLKTDNFGEIVGFENHGGRTYLGKDIQPFGKILKGFGNNGNDGTEGAIYQNSIGTYSHGPILPKNPLLTDYLIKVALEIKYKERIELKEIDNSLEQKARLAIAKRLSVGI